MSIRVRFFASLREDAGTSELALDGAAIRDLDGVLRIVGERLGAGVGELLRSPRNRVAVNQTLVEGNVHLDDGDEVAFLPPVTGG